VQQNIHRRQTPSNSAGEDGETTLGPHAWPACFLQLENFRTKACEQPGSVVHHNRASSIAYFVVLLSTKSSQQEQDCGIGSGEG